MFQQTTTIIICREGIYKVSLVLLVQSNFIIHCFFISFQLLFGITIIPSILSYSRKLCKLRDRSLLTMQGREKIRQCLVRIKELTDQVDSLEFR